MENLKKFEDFDPMNPGEGLRGKHTTVNLSDLDSNLTLDPEAAIYGKDQGLKPFLKKEFGVEPVDPKKSMPIYGVHYMSEEDAEAINVLGAEIKEKVELFNSMLKTATRNEPSKKFWK